MNRSDDSEEKALEELAYDFDELPHRVGSVKLSQSDRKQAAGRDRYKEVPAYPPETRVRVSGAEYFNANFVGANREFIATQAPIESEMARFWTMISERRVSHVFMVTKFVEKRNGSIKAEPYYPSRDAPCEIEFGQRPRVRVACTSGPKRLEGVSSAWVRNLEVQVGIDATPRTLVHVHYEGWPDAGVPESVDDLANMIRLFPYPTKDRPHVVHCSAGIGRTGTFILARMASNHRLQNARQLFDLLAEIREQRMALVQTYEQFLYAYDVVRSLLEPHPADSDPPKKPVRSISSRISNRTSNARRCASCVVREASVACKHSHISAKLLPFCCERCSTAYCVAHCH